MYEFCRRSLPLLLRWFSGSRLLLRLGGVSGGNAAAAAAMVPLGGGGFGEGDDGFGAAAFVASSSFKRSSSGSPRMALITLSTLEASALLSISTKTKRLSRRRSLVFAGSSNKVFSVGAPRARAPEVERE